jgi:hypothetical protein
MQLLKINDRVEFGNARELTGTIVGHGTMQSPGGSTIATYLVRLDEKFQGHLDQAMHTFISTLVLCADGATKI